MEKSRDSLLEEKKSSTDTSEEKPDESVSLTQDEMEKSRDSLLEEKTPSTDTSEEKPDESSVSLNNSLKQDEMEKTPALKDTPNSVEQDYLNKKSKEEDDATLIPTPEASVLAMEESEQSLNLLSIPTIYFYEPIDGNKVTMWGFLHPNLICKI